MWLYATALQAQINHLSRDNTPARDATEVHSAMPQEGGAAAPVQHMSHHPDVVKRVTEEAEQLLKPAATAQPLALHKHHQTTLSSSRTPLIGQVHQRNEWIPLSLCMDQRQEHPITHCAITAPVVG